MKIPSKKITGAAFAGLVAAGLIMALTNPGRSQNGTRTVAESASGNEYSATTAGGIQVITGNSQQVKSRAVPPFILADTTSSSPDTNLVGNLVIFVAKVGGTAPVALQWQVDKGGGFIDVPAATNAWLGITNAQISDTGVYALSATNAAGVIRTTPRAITLIDGVD